MKLLLIFIPAAIVMRFTPYHDSLWMFLLTALGIVPLATLMGEATEELSEHTGPGISGFLNATFGNAPELIIAIMGVLKGGEAIEVVKASITGSILGNLLMITGLSMFLGGLKRDSQKFNPKTVGVTNTMMILAVAGLMAPSTIYWVSSVPTLAHGAEPAAIVTPAGTTPAPAAEAPHHSAKPKVTHANVLSLNERLEELSIGVSILLIIVYILCLIYSFRTRHDVLSPPEAALADDGVVGYDGAHSPKRAIATLFIATVFVAILSEFLVGSLEVAGDALGLNPIFMGLVVVSAIGNVAEHASAVMIAIKGNMDLTLSIAMGSSMQIALFVAPTLVLFSYATGNHVNLVFTPLELVSVALAVALVTALTSDGESNWLEGAQLLCVYLILVLAFYFGF